MAITLSLPTPFATIKAEIAQELAQDNLTAQELEDATWADVEDQIVDMIWELDNDDIVEASGMSSSELHEAVTTSRGWRPQSQDEYDYREEGLIQELKEQLSYGSPELNAEGFVVFEVC